MLRTYQHPGIIYFGAEARKKTQFSHMFNSDFIRQHNTLGHTPNYFISIRPVTVQTTMWHDMWD
jgi:hypothetical protein